MATTVSATFTAVGNGTIIRNLKQGDGILLTLSGTYVAETVLEYSDGAELYWRPIKKFTQDNLVESFSWVVPIDGLHVRLRCTAYTSGTVTYSYNDEDTPVAFSNEDWTIDEEKITFHKPLTFEGALTAEAAITAQSTVDVNTDGNLQLGSVAVSSTAAELNALDGITSTVAELNITDGVTATAAELNLTDGSSATAPAVSTAAILDSAGALRTAENVGTVPGTVTAVEYGDGYNHVTVLTVTAAVFVPDVPADAEGVGALIYTFPAGVHKVSSVSMDITGVAIGSNSNAVEFGAGSVIASGDVSVLSGTATFEDLIDGIVVADISSPTEIANTGGSGDGTIYQAAGSKLFHLNMAGTFTNAPGAGASTVTGTVVIHWTFLGA